VHETVLRDETVALLAPAPGKRFVDGTLGGGGHAEALLKAGAEVIGLDRDPRALAAARERLAGFPKLRTVQSNYSEMAERLAADNVWPVDGILLDLGVSSPQLDEADRGFSFSKEGPLDMRMGDTGLTAAEHLEQATEPELVQVLKVWGEEPFARPIARELKRALPKTTFEAAEAVKRAVPRKAWPNKIHVATRTFQALRIWVNGELTALDHFLEIFPGLIRVGGRVAVISFHSLEDRRVKEAFRGLEGRCICPPGLPVCGCGARGSFKVLTKKSVQPSDAERERNPRSRSARLRAVEKVR
jgi:16S rRNA (cytosine1402-N4)-methyltransferase